MNDSLVDAAERITNKLNHREQAEFLEGFKHAVDLLGSEGDYRHIDWSAPYEFLKNALRDQQKLYADFDSIPSPHTSALRGPKPDPVAAEREACANQQTLLGMQQALAFIDFVNLWMNRDNVDDDERISVIKHHPVARARAAAIRSRSAP